MEFPTPLLSGRLVRRYRRFLADVVLEDGAETTVHCPNTGAMAGCDRPGSRVWLSRSDNPRRKYPLTWEIVEASPGTLVGIHSSRANALVGEALAAGALTGWPAPTELRREVTLTAGDPETGNSGAGSSGIRMRVDLVAQFPGEDGPCVIEVKSVTAADGPGRGFFPDAVSARAVRHLDALAALSREGRRCVLVYCVQRGDVERLRAAAEIDPAYAAALVRARADGVEFRAWRWDVSPAAIRLAGPVALDPVVV
jgi:sugar fermentation stimulation protein A